MKSFSLFSLGVFLASFCVAASVVSAQKDKKEIVRPAGYAPPTLAGSAQLQSILTESVNEVLSSYPAGSFKPSELAATIIDVRDPANLKWANLNGEQKIYP